MARSPGSSPPVDPRAPVGIVADDLTGAGDTALAFLAPQTDVWVLSELGPGARWPANAGVLAINSESRHLLPADAARQASRAARFLLAGGAGHFYKKIDSTLRGNLAAEIEAMMQVLEMEIALVAPAFPQAGRITVGGYQLVDGLPVNASAYARDALAPVKHSHLPTLLLESGIDNVAHVGLKDVMAGPEAIAHALVRAVAERKRVLVADAARPEDLGAIARALALMPFRVLPVGSAGLAAALQPHRLLDAPARSLLVGGHALAPPVLVVAGSLNAVTAAQVGVMAQRAHLAILDVPALLLRGPAELDRLVAVILLALGARRDVVLATVGSEADLRRHRALERDLGLGAVQTGAQVAQALGMVVARVVAETALAGLVLAGGETALGVCRALGGGALRIEEALLPAVPRCRLETPRGALGVVTKSGGFGAPDALVKLSDALRRSWVP